MCKSFITVGLILAALMSTWSLQAAGLGKLTVNSSLGQPFKAEIDLIALKKADIPSLSARLAPRDAFRKADVDYAPFFSTFAVSVEVRSDGQPYIKIISSQPVIEPFLNMLIELNWSSGRLLREYVVLLDLPETDLSQPALATTQFVPLSRLHRLNHHLLSLKWTWLKGSALQLKTLLVTSRLRYRNHYYGNRLNRS